MFISVASVCVKILTLQAKILFLFREKHEQRLKQTNRKEMKREKEVEIHQW